MVKCWPRNLGVVYLQGLHNFILFFYFFKYIIIIKGNIIVYPNSFNIM